MRDLKSVPYRSHPQVKPAGRPHVGLTWVGGRLFPIAPPTWATKSASNCSFYAIWGCWNSWAAASTVCPEPLRQKLVARNRRVLLAGTGENLQRLANIAAARPLR